MSGRQGQRVISSGHFQERCTMHNPPFQSQAGIAYSLAADSDPESPFATLALANFVRSEFVDLEQYRKPPWNGIAIPRPVGKRCPDEGLQNRVAALAAEALDGICARVSWCSRHSRRVFVRSYVGRKR